MEKTSDENIGVRSRDKLRQFALSMMVLDNFYASWLAACEPMLRLEAQMQAISDYATAQMEMLNAISETKEFKEYPFLMCGFMSAKEGNRLSKMWLDGKFAEVKNELHEYSISENFEREIMKVVDNSRLLSRRKPIIADALEAHKNGKYSLSIPVLYAQVDGAFIELFKPDYKRENPNANKMMPLARSKFNQHQIWIGWSAIVFIESTYHKKRSPIVHGIDTDYYKDRDLSTILFFALSSIENLEGLYVKIEKAATTQTASNPPL